MAERRRSLWSATGLRPKLTAIAAVVVTIPLLLGSGVFALTLSQSLTAQLEGSLRTQLGVALEGLAEDGPELGRELDLPTTMDLQVVDQIGTLVVDRGGGPPGEIMSTLRPTPGQVLSEKPDHWGLKRDAEPRIVYAGAFRYHDAVYTVLLGQSRDHLRTVVGTATAHLLVSVPILVLVVSGLTWWMVGVALHSVERIRTRVEQIEAANLDTRVDVPAARDEISALAVTMNGMLDRLESSQRAQERFISDASHELRSPIASLQAAVEVAGRSGDADVWTEMAPLIEAETERLQSLVSGLLLLTRADDQGLPLERGEVDLDDIVLAEVRRARDVFDVVFASDVHAARLHGDGPRLAQAVRNLLDNAARHARGTVRVEVGSAPGEVVLAVEDDGNGVPEADRERVFERFVRLDESRSRDAGGSGLGLAIVREIVAAHRGRVELVDGPHLGGARFVVHLPDRPDGHA